MKKLSLFLAILFLLAFNLSPANAAEYEYANIDDESTIDNDFKVLGIDINDYYKPTAYDYAKWYVVGMSETYLENYNMIQTYFYLYNPTRYGEESDYLSSVSSFDLTATMNGVEQKCSGAKLDYNKEHCLYKVKGFTYDFVESAKIRISKIQHHNMRGLGITSDSNFFATVNHSKLNGFSVELNFNTTLIIEEYDVVEIEVKKDDNFINNWDDFWSCSTTEMLVYFYNFNFPDHIKPDSIEYAAFQYDYKYYYEKIWLKSWDFTPDPELAEYNEKTLLESEKVFSEYNNDSKTLRVNKHSQELTFPTFYLGNRIKDKQFGTLDVSGELDSFDYDCSILLDSSYKSIEREYGFYKPLCRGIVNHINYTSLDNVEFIELHYEKNGITYKCQVVNKPVDEDDFNHGVAEPPKKEEKSNIWDKIKEFLINMANSILKVLHIPEIPDGGKIALSIGILILAAWLIKFIIKKILS